MNMKISIVLCYHLVEEALWLQPEQQAEETEAKNIIFLTVIQETCH